MTTKRRVKRSELEAAGSVDAKEFLAELTGGPMGFGEMLASHRECEGVTLQEFADRMEMTRQRVCDYEKRRKLPSPEMAWKMGEMLGYSGPQFARSAIEEAFQRNGILASVTISARSDKRVA